MFIRFQDRWGDGVYRGVTEYSDSKFYGIFDLMGELTRSPHEYSGMVEGDPFRGVDRQFTKFLKPGNKFAWKYDFFLRVSNGNLHDSELDFLQRMEWEFKFIDTDHLRKRFVEACLEEKISIMLIQGPVLAESEQQVVYHEDKVEMVDEINEQEFFLLSADAEVF